MIKYKGRCNLIVFLPSKPTKYVFEDYFLTDSITGYTLNWQFHDEVKNI